MRSMEQHAGSMRGMGHFTEQTHSKENYTMLRCSKHPQYHYGFLFVNQPCLTGCGGYGALFEIDGNTGTVIGPA